MAAKAGGILAATPLPDPAMSTSHPAFFAHAPRIRMYEPLAVFLGGSEDGLFDYTYLDAVKLAGHSCPTVAGSFLMLRAGLKALYGGDLPERGAVRVRFPEAADSGVTGVMAQVASLVTGGRDYDGFHGIGGRFGRNGLLAFAEEVAGTMALERIDGGGWAVIDYRPHIVPADSEMVPLLQLCLAGRADAGQKREFGRLWQDRVRRILVDHQDDADLVQVAAGGRRR